MGLYSPNRRFEGQPSQGRALYTALINENLYGDVSVTNLL